MAQSMEVTNPWGYPQIIHSFDRDISVVKPGETHWVFVGIPPMFKHPAPPQHLAKLFQLGILFRC